MYSSSLTRNACPGLSWLSILLYSLSQFVLLCHICNPETPETIPLPMIRRRVLRSASNILLLLYWSVEDKNTGWISSFPLLHDEESGKMKRQGLRLNTFPFCVCNRREHHALHKLTVYPDRQENWSLTCLCEERTSSVGWFELQVKEKSNCFLLHLIRWIELMRFETWIEK